MKRFALALLAATALAGNVSGVYADEVHVPMRSLGDPWYSIPEQNVPGGSMGGWPFYNQVFITVPLAYYNNYLAPQPGLGLCEDPGSCPLVTITDNGVPGGAIRNIINIEAGEEFSGLSYGDSPHYIGEYAPYSYDPDVPSGFHGTINGSWNTVRSKLIVDASLKFGITDLQYGGNSMIHNASGGRNLSKIKIFGDYNAIENHHFYSNSLKLVQSILGTSNKIYSHLISDAATITMGIDKEGNPFGGDRNIFRLTGILNESARGDEYYNSGDDLYQKYLDFDPDYFGETGRTSADVDGANITMKAFGDDNKITTKYSLLGDDGRVLSYQDRYNWVAYTEFWLGGNYFNNASTIVDQVARGDENKLTANLRLTDNVHVTQHVQSFDREEERPIYELQDIYEDQAIYEDQEVYGYYDVYEDQPIIELVVNPDTGEEEEVEVGSNSVFVGTEYGLIGTEQVQVGTESVYIGQQEVEVGTELVVVTVPGDHNELTAKATTAVSTYSTMNVKGGSNKLTTDQWGAYNNTKLDITGSGNQFVVKQVGDLFADTTYTDPTNKVDLNVKGDNNVAATVEMAGTEQVVFAGISQVGAENNAKIAITGNENLLDISQVGTGDGVEQGTGNKLDVSIVASDGIGSASRNKVTTKQFGFDNNILITQNGNSNTILATQGSPGSHVTGNWLHVHQTGNQNNLTSIQNGSGNQFIATQNGASNNMALKGYGDGNILTGTQIGSNNSMILVSNTNNAQITGTQNGANNTLNLTVNRPSGVLLYNQSGIGKTYNLTLN